MYFGSKHRNRGSLVLRSLILMLAISAFVLFPLTPPGFGTKTADAGCFVLTDICDVVTEADVCLTFADNFERHYEVGVGLASGVTTRGACGDGSIQLIGTDIPGISAFYLPDGHGGVHPYVLVFDVTPNTSFVATFRVTGYSANGDPIKCVICVSILADSFNPNLGVDCKSYSCSIIDCE